MFKILGNKAYIEPNENRFAALKDDADSDCDSAYTEGNNVINDTINEDDGEIGNLYNENNEGNTNESVGALSNSENLNYSPLDDNFDDEESARRELITQSLNRDWFEDEEGEQQEGIQSSQIRSSFSVADLFENDDHEKIPQATSKLSDSRKYTKRVPVEGFVPRRSPRLNTGLAALLASEPGVLATTSHPQSTISKPTANSKKYTFHANPPTSSHGKPPPVKP